MLRDRGSSYKAYIFEESIRRYAINYKGQGRKKVIYLREVYTRAQGSPIEAPIVGFRNTTPPPIKVKLR